MSSAGRQVRQKYLFSHTGRYKASFTIKFFSLADWGIFTLEKIQQKKIYLSMDCRMDAFSATMSRIMEECRPLIQDSDEFESRLEIAAREMLANALEHGCSCEREKVMIVLTLDFSKIKLKVVSPGSGFDIASASMNYMPAEEKTGRGLPMIRIAADKVKFNQKGNIITAVFEEKSKMEGLRFMQAEMEGEWARIKPEGSINITNAEELRNEFKRVMEQGVDNFILDLKDVEDIDSAALGKILIVNSTLEEKGGKLVIESASSENVKRVLDAVNLSDMIEIR